MKLREFIIKSLLVIVLAIIAFACNENNLTEYNDPNPANMNSPVVTSINPSEAFLKDTVTIIGSGFNKLSEYNTIFFGNKSGEIISASDTELKVVLPDITGDTVEVRVSVKGAVEWSNKINFAFKNTISIFAENINNAWGIAADNDGNIYVGSYDDKAIYKITETGEKTLFVSNIPINGAIHFGQDNSLYACEAEKGKIVKISLDGKTIEDYATISWPVDFDWDSNGKLFVVMNWGGIYSQNSDGSFTSEANAVDGNIISMRIFGNKLYANSSWNAKVQVYNITANGLEVGEAYTGDYTVMGIDIDQSGKVYYHQYWANTLYTIESDGTQGSMYDNLITVNDAETNPVRFMTFSKKSLYAVVNAGVDKPGGGTTIMKLYIGVNGAPVFGVNK